LRQVRVNINFFLCPLDVCEVQCAAWSYKTVIYLINHVIHSGRQCHHDELPEDFVAAHPQKLSTSQHRSTKINYSEPCERLNGSVFDSYSQISNRGRHTETQYRLPSTRRSDHRKIFRLLLR